MAKQTRSVTCRLQRWSWRILIGTAVSVGAILATHPSTMEIAGAGPVSAASPAPIIDLPGTPSPDECRVEARTVDELTSLAAASTPTTATPYGPDTVGRPADATTARELVETVREAVACANANEPLRALALFTDRYLAWRFGPEHPDDLGSLITATSRTPVPAAESDRLALVEVREIRLLPDGRATAIVVTENALQRFEDRLIFARAGGRWLIDEWHPVGDAPATPTA